MLCFNFVLINFSLFFFTLRAFTWLYLFISVRNTHVLHLLKVLKTLGLLGVPDPVKLRLYRLKRVGDTSVHRRDVPSSGPFTMWAGSGSEKLRAGRSSMLEAGWPGGITGGVGNGGGGFIGAGGTGYRIDRLGVGNVHLTGEVWV